MTLLTNTHTHTHTTDTNTEIYKTSAKKINYRVIFASRIREPVVKPHTLVDVLVRLEKVRV